MARKKLIEESAPAPAQNPLIELQILIPQYVEHKEQESIIKKVITLENSKIKEIMISNGLTEVEAGENKAVLSTATTDAFDEAALIEKVRAMKIRGLIKKKEYVDMDILEDSIYHGKINAADLADTQTHKTTISLRLGKIK